MQLDQFRSINSKHWNEDISRLTLGNAASCLGVIRSGTRDMLEVANDRD